MTTDLFSALVNSWIHCEDPAWPIRRVATYRRRGKMSENPAAEEVRTGRSRRGVIVIVVAVALLVVGGTTAFLLRDAFVDPANREHTVRYELSGEGRAVIEYWDGSKTVQVRQGLPWSVEVTVKGTEVRAKVAAQSMNSGTVLCHVKVDGELVVASGTAQNSDWTICETTRKF